jgi:hypothetical protein
MSAEEAEFVQFTREYFSLPMLVESRGLVCFRHPMLTHNCVPDSIEQITGPVLDYGTGAAKPTKLQCYSMLKALWPFVTYWFNKLFPGFVGPINSTSLELLSIRAVVYMWILQFGASVMDTWTDVKALVSGNAKDWENYMAWIDSDPGFSVNRGIAAKAFPVELQAWLVTTCNGVTNGCKDLAVFNLKSSVCEDSGCSAEVQGYCKQIDTSSNCSLA